MANLESMDLATLQNMLNEAGTYDERAAIRKAIRLQKAATGKTPEQPSSAYRRPGGRAAPATGSRVNQYQFVGGPASSSGSSSSSTRKVTEQRSVKTQPRESNNLSSSSQKTSSSVLTDRQQNSTSDRQSKAKEQSSSQDVSTVNSSKIEEAVTVVTKEEEEAPQESVDEVQIVGSSDEIELVKSSTTTSSDKPILQSRDEQSEVVVDIVVSGGNTSAVPAVSEAVSDNDSAGSAPNQPVEERVEEAAISTSAVDSESANQSSNCELDEDEEEEAIERQIQSTLNYTERKELRARLRQLRKNRKASQASGGSVSSYASTPADAPTRSIVKPPSPLEEPKKEEPAQVQEAEAHQPEPEPETTSEQQQLPEVSIEEVDSGCCLLVDGGKDGDVSPSVKSADLSPVSDYSSQNALSPVDQDREDFADVETSSQASSTSDSSERRATKVTSSDEPRKPKDATTAALGQSEGVSDFRTVLRKGNSPAPQRKGAAGGEQKDFRTVLKKSDTPAAAGKGGKSRAEQQDFRGSLKRKVKTKDCSSAAPRRDGAAQEDFRTVLKKTDKDAAPSPLLSRKEVSAAPATPPVSKKPVAPPTTNSETSRPAETKADPVETPRESVDEVDGLGASRMTVPKEVEQVEMPSVASEAQPSVALTTTCESLRSKSTKELLAMDPLDSSLTYDERREIRRLQREARRQGGDVASAVHSSPAKKSEDHSSYEERRKLRQEAKRQEELARQKQRQQFTAQLQANSPQTSPSKVVQRSSGAQQLLEWCRRRTTHYENIEIKDFRSSWRNGLAFAALMSSLCPGEIPYDELSAQTAERNFELAFAASERAGLPAMLDVEDMMLCSIPDEKSVMTYVSSIYKHFT